MWRKRRHSATYFILRPIIKIVLKFKYNYKPQKYKGKDQVLILTNHTMTLDFFFVAVAFRKPIYFLASDDLLNRGFLSSVMKFLVAPIPKNKSIKDSKAVRGCLQVAKEGGTIGIFPEGNRSLSGDLCPIDISIVKLCRKLNIKLVVYAIEGGYQSDPRYCIKKRKGKMRGIIKKVLTPEEISKLTDEELYDIIIEGLTVNLIKDKKFSSNKKAVGLQRAIYYCESCDTFGNMKTEKNKLYCSKCNSTYVMNKYCFLTKDDKEYTVSDLYKIQRNKIISLNETTSIHYTDNISLNVVTQDSRETVYEGIMELKNNTIIIGDLSFHFDEIESIAVIMKNKMNIYVNNVRYQTVGIDLFCATKYQQAFYHYKNLENGITGENEFLGI